MLSVSFSLALVAAMLFGIVLPGHHKEVDKFNGQTRRPIPMGYEQMVIGLQQFKAAGRPRVIFSPAWNSRTEQGNSGSRVSGLRGVAAFGRQHTLSEVPEQRKHFRASRSHDQVLAVG